MEKDIIMQNMKFRTKCSEYGIDWDNFEIVEDTIVLTNEKGNVCVLLDQNYNTIAIHKIDYTLGLNDKIKSYQYQANHAGDNAGISFLYPFQNLSLVNIMDLGDRIEVLSSNITVNGRLVEKKNNEYYIALLSYIKFLADQIKNYFLNAYHMKTLGFNTPDIYSYTRRLMQEIREYIDNCISEDKRPYPAEFCAYIGIKRGGVENCWNILYEIIYLHLEQLGEEFPSDTLDTLASKLLRILEVPIEEVEKQHEENSKNFEIPTINLSEWLENKNKPAVLKKG